MIKLSAIISLWLVAIALAMTVGLGVQAHHDHQRFDAWGACFDDWHAYNQTHFPVSSDTWNKEHNCNL